MEPANPQSELPSPPPSMPPVDQPITHSTPPEVKEKKKSILIPIMLVVFFLLAIIFAGITTRKYFQSKQQNVSHQIRSELPTNQSVTDQNINIESGWNTYSDEDANFTIKYPSDEVTLPVEATHSRSEEKYTLYINAYSINEPKNFAPFNSPADIINDKNL